MTEFLDPVSGGGRLALLIVSVAMFAVAAIPVAVVGLVQWRKVREREELTGLIHSLLARGFSAEEIECVLKAALFDGSRVTSLSHTTDAPFAGRI